MFRNFKKLILMSVFINHSFILSADRDTYVAKVYTAIKRSMGYVDGSEAEILSAIDLTMFSTDRILPLAYAASAHCWWPNKCTIEFLLDHGHDINGRQSDNITPLHEAVMFGSKDTVELLLSRGARFDIPAKYIYRGAAIDVTAVDLAQLWKEISLKDTDLNWDSRKKRGQIAKMLKIKRDGPPAEQLY